MLWKEKQSRKTEKMVFEIRVLGVEFFFNAVYKMEHKRENHAFFFFDRYELKGVL